MISDRFHDLIYVKAKRGRKTVEVYEILKNYNDSKGVV